MANYYLSKNYIHIKSAGNKAKTDIEKILKQSGYKNAGLPQTICSNKLIGFLLTFIGVMKVIFTVSRNDIVVLQYPLKKYYSFVCKIIHLKKGRVITIIHDLGSFRRRKLTSQKEIIRLHHSDCLIVHNNQMKEWLLNHSYEKPMVSLGIFDFLSSTENNNPRKFDNSSIRVIYAGALNYRKNKFLYDVDGIISDWQLELYGSGFEEEKILNKQHFKYKGFIPSDQLIEQADAHFGLLWDGDQINTCSGDFGEYLKYNNPHKISFYIRCHLPIIIWKEAALATFVQENKIGICIDSITQLNELLPAISPETYNEMVQHTKKISKKLATGYNIQEAMQKAMNYVQK